MSSLSLIAREKYIRLTAVFLLLITLLSITLFVANVLVSVVIAFVITYLLSPFVKWLERHGMDRQWSVLLPFAGFLLLFGVFVLLLAPSAVEQCQHLQSEFPKIRQDTLTFLGGIEVRIQETFHLPGFSLREKINNWIFDQTAILSTQIPAWLTQSLTVLFLSPVFAYFMLLDGRSMMTRIISLAPNKFFELFLNLQHQINHQIGHFIRAKLLESLIVGLCVGLGLAAIGFPYAALLAVVAGATNVIPYIGPVFGILPALLLAVISPETMPFESVGLNLFLVTSVYAIAQLIDNLVVIPVVVAKMVDLHPLVVIMTIFIGAEVMGIMGMIISIPVTAAAKLIFTTLFHHLINFRAAGAR